MEKWINKYGEVVSRHGYREPLIIYPDSNAMSELLTLCVNDPLNDHKHISKLIDNMFIEEEY